MPRSLDLLRLEPRVDDNSSDQSHNRVDGLIDLFNSLPTRPKLVVEVGTYRGVAAETMLHFCDHLIAVDVWPPPVAYAKRDFEARMANELNVSYLRMYSVDAADLFRKLSIDLVYIDAAHDEASVAADIEAWMPKVKYGGWIAGHDYSDKIENGGVIRAVDSTLGKPKAVFSDTSWLVRI
jgi:predicted O-methyltransferase YrrM